MENSNTFNTEYFMSEFISVVKNTFKNRVVFIGLQGSRARKEETQNSDIDTVVILDNLSFDDLLPVSYTHLDVYKRQPKGTLLTDIPS